MKQANELRHENRFPVSATVHFAWKTQGASGTGAGCTRDISIAGVFVTTSSLVPVGSSVSLDLQLPPLMPKAQAIGLRTRGRVVRADEEGFAAQARMDMQMDFGLQDDDGDGEFPFHSGDPPGGEKKDA